MSEDVEKLRSLLAAATPGPWTERHWKGAPDGCVYAGSEWIANASVENCRLIAAAREALSVALDEIDRLRAIESAAARVVSERRAALMHARETTSMCRLARLIGSGRKGSR